MREKRQQRPDDDDDRPKWKKRGRKRDLFRSEKGGREASFRLPPILLLLPRRNDKQRRRKKKAFSPLLFRRGEPKAVVGRTGETKRGEGEWSGAAAASISPSLYHTIIHFHSGGIRRRQQFLAARPPSSPPSPLAVPAFVFGVRGGADKNCCRRRMPPLWKWMMVW